MSRSINDVGLWNTHIIRKTITVVLLIAFIFQHPTLVTQAAAPRDSATVTINGGGGVLTNGSDGLKLTYNVSSYGEQITYKNKNFHYNNGDFGFHLNIGGTLYTSLNGSKSSLELTDYASTFDSLTISNLTGSANTSGATTTGSGGVRMLYSVTVGSLTYSVQRDITYTSPKTFYTDEYSSSSPLATRILLRFIREVTSHRTRRIPEAQHTLLTQYVPYKPLIHRLSCLSA